MPEPATEPHTSLAEPVTGAVDAAGRQPAPDPGIAPILAFGGVVWERRGDETRVVVVHRPRYDDWSFPKGKVEPGEAPELTARREVEEETGLCCTVGAPLGELRYRTDTGALKVVGYWAMQVESRRERPADDEVDDVAWWTTAEAAQQLTHDQDRELLARFVALVP